MNPIKIKKIKFAFIIGIITLISCNTINYTKLMITIPGKGALDIEKHEKLFILDFLVKKEAKDFDLNTETINFLIDELSSKLKMQVSKKDFSIENEDLFKNEQFWKNFSDQNKAAFLSGIIQFNEETRKSIKDTRTQRFEDPFPLESKIQERKFYNLSLDIYIIDAQTGKSFYKQNYKQTKSYKNLNQTPYFAFFDLMQNLKQSLFYNLLGTEQNEARYLIH